MTTTVYPENETARLNALKRYDILDTPPDGSFNRMTALAAKIFNVPIAIISMVDTDRIWFKSHHGLEVDQIGRDPGLCASAILSDDIYIVEDAKEDPRTLANPLVVSEFGLRFYAGAPLQTMDGYNLGTFCIIDRKQRYITEAQKVILQELSAIAMDEIEMRLAARNAVKKGKDLLQASQTQLQQCITELQAPAYAADPKLATLVSSSKEILFQISDYLQDRNIELK